MIRVSKRLQAIGDFVPDGSVLVDIGTDHALLLIKLLKSGKISKGYGIDIAKGPLQSAKKNLLKYNIENQIQLLQSDGLKSFNESDATCYVIAGMGYKKINEIIHSYNFVKNDIIIVQASSKPYKIRETMSGTNMLIIDEQFITENDRNYIIIKAKITSQPNCLTNREVLLGPKLINYKKQDFINYLQRRLSFLEEVKILNSEFENEYEEINVFLKEQIYE